VLWGTPAGGQPFVAGHVREGRFSLAPDARGRPALVLGRTLAEALDVRAGDAVTVFSTRQLRHPTEALGVPPRPRVRQFHVAGLYETGLADFDQRFAFADLATARALFGYEGGEVTRFDLTLDDLERSPDVALAVTDEVGPPVVARSIHEVFRNLFAWVELQESIVPLVISVLVVVAAFNIVGTLLMVILDKTREIGVLLAMGASRGAVRRLFVTFGLFVGGVGAAVGAALALALALVQQRYGVIPLPQEAYYLDTAPIELRALDFVLVPALAVALCAFAAWLPARVAARVEPVRSIRFGS
jgi:lipoprotein-releasing system permease protein